jgi:hypothetical protein
LLRIGVRESGELIALNYMCVTPPTMWRNSVDIAENGGYLVGTLTPSFNARDFALLGLLGGISFLI